MAEWDARLGPAWVHTRGHAERGWLARARGLAAAQAAELFELISIKFKMHY